jgi:hypothetical protein
MVLKLWNRAEPIKSALLWVGGLILLVEAMLLIGGQWLLVDQDESQGSDYHYDRYAPTPATRTWRILTCTYWTGRSTQTIEANGEYDPVPMECPFVTSAQ